MASRRSASSSRPLTTSFCVCATSARSRSTRSRSGSLGARRSALAWLPEPVIVEKVFTDLAARWPDRGSGYVRITHLGRRVGDSAPQMLLELVPAPEKPTAEKTDAAAEPKPRRRLALPRRRTAAKTDSKTETNAKAAAGTTATKKKKTAKGAAT